MPNMPTDEYVTSFITLHDGTQLRTHSHGTCLTEVCVVHNPTDHHMRSWGLEWRADIKVMERLCPHGIGHPDPDDLAFFASLGQTWQEVHGCDGCCFDPNRAQSADTDPPASTLAAAGIAEQPSGDWRRTFEAGPFWLSIGRSAAVSVGLSDFTPPRSWGRWAGASVRAYYVTLGCDR